MTVALSLFPEDEPPRRGAPLKHEKRTADITDSARALGQFFTPWWAAQALVQRWFSDLQPGDVVLEATCGHGPFLKALPDYVEAIGVEIDPVLAETARRLTGRRVITGDFTKVPLDVKVSAVLGNPPFRMDLVDRLLARCHELLPNDGRVGWILPASSFQTPSRVIRYSEQWSLTAEMLPRTLFPGLQCPLFFGQFRKDAKRLLIGLALYREAHDVSSMPAAVASALRESPDTWKGAISHALAMLGGRARLDEIYRAVEPRRPTGNPWWKEMVRKVLRTDFHWVGQAEYALQPG